jgi:ABC-type transport system involved in cytochrome c biogenesis permease subunit
MPESQPNEMQIYQFGKLPLAYQGRIKPYDTLALNTLQIISGRQRLSHLDENGEKTYRPAIVWLLDVISGSDRANDHQVFRIDNPEVLDTLGLEHRPQYWLYSLRELDTKPGALQRQIELAAKVPEDERSKFQQQVIALAAKRHLYVGIKYAFEKSPIPRDIGLLLDVVTGASADAKRQMLEAFQPRPVPKDPQQLVDFLSAFAPASSPEETQQLVERLEQSPELLENVREGVAARLQQEREARAGGLRSGIVEMLRSAEAPCAVPPTNATVDWKPLFTAQGTDSPAIATTSSVNPAATILRNLLDAYANGNVTQFNQLLSTYRRLLSGYEKSISGKAAELKAARSEMLSQPKIDFEVFYNRFSPFYYAAVLYLVAFVLGVWSWIGWSEPLRRASMWLLVLTLVLHTFALVARIYISGRPPITNLYSTAIFIGWGGVILAMMLEMIYRLGLGNIVAAVIGFLTLLVAHFLSLDGDTFIVLQAVLDTQFWLATHVVTINLGYAATYTAGLWGAIYVLFAHVFPVLTEDSRHKLQRMLYGTLCFAIYLSFVGTVLGGLWGDDSWGRFWGWDPKENGALMIVIWNALVLHARWGGLVKGRGLATLAVAGNIVTTWSYFGVNELGEGLHAYGASESSTAMWLLTFAASQFALIVLGMMPKQWFEALSLQKSQATA